MFPMFLSGFSKTNINRSGPAAVPGQIGDCSVFFKIVAGETRCVAEMFDNICLP